MTVSVNQVICRLGLVIYVLSFFLVATGDPKWPQIGRLRGYECAYTSLTAAVTDTPFSAKNADSATSADVFQYFSVLISGLVNPVFLIYEMLVSLKRLPRTARILKFAVLFMIPFCWVVFDFLEVYPREGHVFWVVGMLLVLVSSWKQVRAQAV